MKWSFKLGRFFGIDVFVHFTFLILLSVVGLAHWLPSQSLAAAASGVIFFLLIFLCVLLHECGHALMARIFGVATHDITLLPIGGVARLDRLSGKPMQELWVALAGPAVNIGIALLLAAWLTFTHAWEPLSLLGIADGGIVERLLAVNLGLALFNMLPAFPLDGGRALRAVLALRVDYTHATRIATTTGKFMAILLAVCGLFMNPLLILIAVFIWAGAGQEASHTQVRSIITGGLVRDAMVTRFHTVTAHTTLREMADIMLSGAQSDYPVTKRAGVIGMLTHADLLSALRTQDMETPVVAIMRTNIPTVEESTSLDDVLLHERDDDTSIPVLKNGVLVGLLTEENLHEYFIIREAHSGLDLPWSRGIRIVREEAVKG